MSRMKTLAFALALTAAPLTATLVPALAQAQGQPPAPGAQAPVPPHPGPRAERPSRIEGRLAFLKTELKITDAQAKDWDALAQVMRQNDQARRERMKQMREQMEQSCAQGQQPQTMNAVDRFERGIRASETRTEEMKQFVAALRPLYASFSPEQKKTADELFARHHGGHHGHGGPRRL